MNNDITALTTTVQKNCHISDALYARDYSLCIYLLKMREYFRWERGYGYTDSLPEAELGQWLVEREQLWQELEQADFEPLPIREQQFGPFDSALINDELLPDGLIYSGGIGSSAKPLFFLATLERKQRIGERRVLIAGRELARDLTAPPAMTQGDTIFVRRESLRRMLWERLEEWRWRKQDTPMGRAARHYDFDKSFDRALNAMTDAEIDSLILHELGEFQAGERLGGQWETMLAALSGTRAEFLARAARDHLADCLVTLPSLLNGGQAASLHFYFANLTGMRKALFPSLVKAYETWHENDRTNALAAIVTRGGQYWASICAELLDRHGHDDLNVQDPEKLAL